MKKYRKLGSRTATLSSKTSQRNIIREKSGPTRYALRTSGLLGDCFCLFFRNNLDEEGRSVFSDNWKDTTVVELKKVIGTLLLVGVH